MLFTGYVNALVVEKCLMDQLPQDLFSQSIVRNENPEILELMERRPTQAVKGIRRRTATARGMLRWFGKSLKLRSFWAIAWMTILYRCYPQ
jgi:hypothetical protein